MHLTLTYPVQSGGCFFTRGNVRGYCFGFNVPIAIGKMKDDEVYGEGNAYAFEYRIHDARIGRFLSVDPIYRDYPWNSTYAFAENDVIRCIDLEGLEKASPDERNQNGVILKSAQDNARFDNPNSYGNIIPTDENSLSENESTSDAFSGKLTLGLRWGVQLKVPGVPKSVGVDLNMLSVDVLKLESFDDGFGEMKVLWSGSESTFSNGVEITYGLFGYEVSNDFTDEIVKSKSKTTAMIFTVNKRTVEESVTVSFFIINGSLTKTTVYKNGKSFEIPSKPVPSIDANDIGDMNLKANMFLGFEVNMNFKKLLKGIGNIKVSSASP